jgi:hypothetical protein
MIKTSIFSILLLVVVNTFGANNFYELSPSGKTISGVKYPRNEMTLFRGTGDGQMSPQMAVRALLGDSSVYVESFFFSAIKNKLLDRPLTANVQLNSYLDGKISEAKSSGLTEEAAIKITRRLVDETFSYYEKRNSLISTYVDYNSGSYVDWPQDVVFSSILSPAAATYGNRILVIQEKTKRSLDLNYWNKEKNDVWYHHTRDIGEFVAFGYIPGSDLIGYQVRDGSSKSWHSIRYALFKPLKDVKNYVLVFSGQRQSGQKSTCMDVSSSEKTYRHCDYTAGQIATEPPKINLNEKIKLVGVISLCDKKQDCALPDSKELNGYDLSDDSSVVAEINDLIGSIKNQDVRFFRSESLQGKSSNKR